MLILQRRSSRHLSLCGVRCNTGTDGMFFPTLMTAALKATWTLVALISALHLFIHPNCESPAIPIVLTVSVICFMVVQCGGILNDIVIIAVSSRGSLSNFSPRKKIEVFVYVGWAIYLVEIVWDAFSTYAIFSPEVQDEELGNCTAYATALTIYRAVILSHWGLVIMLFVVFTFLLDPLNCCLLSAKINDIEQVLEDMEEEGSEQNDFPGFHRNPFNCAVWCRCCDGGANRKNALSDLVHLFRVIFDGLETEYTFLDLVAGFRLQLIYHSKLRDSGIDPVHLIKEKTVAILSRDEQYSKPAAPKELLPHELNQYSADLKHYLKYAMAAYGWPIDVYLNPVRGPASLCLNTRCQCCCARCQEPHFDGNKCFPNQAAIKAMTGVHDDDIITASFVNLIDIVPFFVVRVESGGRKEVIVAIRGTLSIKDALTDASARMKEVPGGILGVKPAFIHRGIYQAAKGVYDHLVKNENFVDLASKPEYKIALTGHSLGAGVASVLAVMFKEHNPDWSQDLRAYNFATPPVFSYALAEKTQSFITTVVSGYDIVPRMTIRGLAHLAISVKDLIDNSCDTKQSVLCCVDCKKPEIDPDIVQQRQREALLHLDVKRPGTVETDGEEKREGYGAIVETKKKEKFKFGKHLLEHLSKLVVMGKSEKREPGSPVEEEAMMFTTGRIIHLEVEQVDSLKRCCSCGLKIAGQVKASWRSREDFSGINVHSSMLLDHGPTRTIDFVTTFCNQVTVETGSSPQPETDTDQILLGSN